VSLDDYELTLRDGYRLKPVGNRFVVLNEGGMAVGPPLRCESYAVKKLIDLRIERTRRERQRRAAEAHRQGEAVHA
jgi:hypothetical protein